MTLSRGNGRGHPALSKRSSREPPAGAALQKPSLHALPGPQRGRGGWGSGVQGSHGSLPSGPAGSPLRPRAFPVNRPPGITLLLKGRERVASLSGTPPGHRTPTVPQITSLSSQRHRPLGPFRKDVRVPLGWLSAEHVQGQSSLCQDACSLLRDGASEHCPTRQESEHRARPSTTRPPCPPLSG